MQFSIKYITSPANAGDEWSGEEQNDRNENNSSIYADDEVLV